MNRNWFDVIGCLNDSIELNNKKKTDLDGSEDHILTHPHLLLEPKRLTAVVLAFEPVGRVDGLGIRRRNQQADAGHLTLDAGRRLDLPLVPLRVVEQLADLVFADARLNHSQ